MPRADSQQPTPAAIGKQPVAIPVSKASKKAEQKTITGKTRRGARKASEYKAKASGKKATGRPSDYDERYERVVKKMCAIGATDEELAQALGTTVTTLNTWKKEHEEFLAAINKGKDDFDSGRIKTAMRDRALGYNWTEVSEETVEIKAEKLVRDKQGGEYVVARDAKGKPVTVMVPAVKRKVTNKHVPAEPVCMFFWLTNRQRRDWQHIRINKVEGKLDGPAVTNNNFFDLKQVEDRELEQIENFIAKARADKREEAGTGPRGNA